MPKEGAHSVSACVTPMCPQEASLPFSYVYNGVVCHAQGAHSVSAYVTHGVFPKESWRRFTKCNGTADAFTYFWITDSCPRTIAAVQGLAPYDIISLAGPIRAALQI